MSEVANRPNVALNHAPVSKTLRMGWPTEVAAPNKVLVALVEVGGEHCYCNLRLMTGIEPRAFRSAVRLLEDNGYVRLLESPCPGNQASTLEHRRVRLA